MLTVVVAGCVVLLGAVLTEVCMTDLAGGVGFGFGGGSCRLFVDLDAEAGKGDEAELLVVS